jgi:MFS transporter, CP family, cyanate transporter
VAHHFIIWPHGNPILFVYSLAPTNHSEYGLLENLFGQRTNHFRRHSDSCQFGAAGCMKNFPSRRLWLIVESAFELVGLTLLEFHVSPFLACALIGIGAGGLFPLNLLLPIDATGHHHEAAAWSAKAQSVGYVIGALGPIILGWIFDATNSSASAVIAMFVVMLLMIGVQIAATAKGRKPQDILKEAS